MGRRGEFWLEDLLEYEGVYCECHEFVFATTSLNE